ncbi:hypothetical protein Bbelb_295930 [Branchiostoma belcheri]|nr:hypothetical protein Bbelb_295930 [Branchiostoma belcheri]
MQHRCPVDAVQVPRSLFYVPAAVRILLVTSWSYTIPHSNATCPFRRLSVMYGGARGDVAFSQKSAAVLPGQGEGGGHHRALVFIRGKFTTKQISSSLAHGLVTQWPNRKRWRNPFIRTAIPTTVV